ncbi:Type III effector pipB2 [Afipia felis]|uniref:Type III effector pipB2 n=1 Tax=Afipia felis TaxID=1035 RepID=A0A090N7K1_AFIFE|nr:pentapeptide repeat-containing protein [Afipia felis]CEG08743.1 Type III effector pipB2 [Afipia felis]
MTAEAKSKLLKFDVLNRYSGEVQFSAQIDCSADALPSVKLGLAVKWAIKNGADICSANLRSANLCGANLCSANLRSADLYGADLCGADICSANLYGANLCGADLCGANLRSANLRSANLCGANLCGANLYGADLCGADLCGANLCGANLCGANLYGADLCGADLCGADLCGANLRSAENSDLTIAMTRILPEGDLIGWKKCRDNIIVKLRIPEAAKRSHAFGRKCRAEYVDVIEVIGGDQGVSQHDSSTKYIAGQRVTPDKFDENWVDECSSGIHFFITRAEAEAY